MRNHIPNEVVFPQFIYNCRNKALHTLNDTWQDTFCGSVYFLFLRWNRNYQRNWRCHFNLQKRVVGVECGKWLSNIVCFKNTMGYSVSAECRIKQWIIIHFIPFHSAWIWLISSYPLRKHCLVIVAFTSTFHLSRTPSQSIQQTTTLFSLHHSIADRFWKLTEIWKCRNPKDLLRFTIFWFNICVLCFCEPVEIVGIWDGNCLR